MRETLRPDLPRLTYCMRGSYVMRPACFAVLALLFCGAAPAQQEAIPVASAPAPEESVIEIPVRASLAPLITEVEQQVPKRLEKLDAFEMDPRNLFGIRYRVMRDPVKI